MCVSWLHKWQEVARHFNAPTISEIEVGSVRGTGAIQAMERAFHGMTRIEMRCVKCGWLRHITLTGEMPSSAQPSCAVIGHEWKERSIGQI